MNLEHIIGVKFPVRVLSEIIDRAILFIAWNANITLSEKTTEEIINEIIKPYVVPFMCAYRLLDSEKNVAEVTLALYDYIGSLMARETFDFEDSLE